MQATSSIEPADSRAASVLLAIADELTAVDFEARSPVWEGSAYMKISNARGALCELTIADGGTVTWDYRSRDGRHIHPDQITGIVLDLLNPGHDQHPVAIPAHQPDVTLKGAVGRALAGHGLQVTLKLLDRDDDFYEAYAEIEVTNPADPARGTARVTDDGDLSWQCTACGPDGGITPAEIAATLTRALAGAQHIPCHA
jgi:hypothetical protein